jgi:eukaryotic-like serine/threonine-protein kinase
MTQEIPGMMATLASYEGMFGPYHPQTLAITTALAVTLCASGHRADGRRLLERAVGDLTKHHGPHHPVRIRALEAWSILLCQEGDWQAALPVQRELLDCRTHLLGQDHPEALAVRNDLSATLSALNNGPWSISA